MPTDACVFFYDCPACKTKMKPKEGDCCVFCSYGSVSCPPVQAGKCRAWARRSAKPQNRHPSSESREDRLPFRLSDPLRSRYLWFTRPIPLQLRGQKCAGKKQEPAVTEGYPRAIGWL